MNSWCKLKTQQYISDWYFPTEHSYWSNFISQRTAITFLIVITFAKYKCFDKVNEKEKKTVTQTILLEFGYNFALNLDVLRVEEKCETARIKIWYMNLGWREIELIIIRALTYRYTRSPHLTGTFAGRTIYFALRTFSFYHALSERLNIRLARTGYVHAIHVTAR